MCAIHLGMLTIILRICRIFVQRKFNRQVCCALIRFAIAIAVAIFQREADNSPMRLCFFSGERPGGNSKSAGNAYVRSVRDVAGDHPDRWVSPTRAELWFMNKSPGQVYWRSVQDSMVWYPCDGSTLALQRWTSASSSFLSLSPEMHFLFGSTRSLLYPWRLYSSFTLLCLSNAAKENRFEFDCWESQLVLNLEGTLPPNIYCEREHHKRTEACQFQKSTIR